MTAIPEEDLRPSSANFRSITYVMIAVYWFAISFLWGGFLSVILPALNKGPATEVFGADRIETARSIMTSLGIIIAMFVQPLAGAISDRSTHPMGRRRPYMIGGTIGIFISLALIALSGNWWFLLVGYLMLQFTDNIAQGSYQGLMPDIVPEDKRGRASATLAVFQLSGTLLGATLPGILQATLGEITGSQVSLLLVGIVFATNLTLCVIFVKERPFHTTEKISAWQAGMNMFKGVKEYPDFVMLMISRFIFLAAPATVSLSIKGFLETQGFVRPAIKDGILQPVQAGVTLSMILGIVVLTAIIAAFPFSLLSERTGRKRMIYIATAIGLVGAVGLLIPTMMMSGAAQSLGVPLSFANQQAYITANGLPAFQALQDQLDGQRAFLVPLTIFFGIFIGSSWGAFSAVDWAYATDLIPLSEAGRFMGLSNLATAGSQAFAATIIGILLDSTPFGYSGAFVLVALYYIISAAVLTKVRETRGGAVLQATPLPAAV